MTESRSISVVDSAMLIQNEMMRGGPGRGFSGRRSWQQRQRTGGDKRGTGGCDGWRREALAGRRDDVGLTRWTGRRW